MAVSTSEDELVAMSKQAATISHVGTDDTVEFYARVLYRVAHGERPVSAIKAVGAQIAAVSELVQKGLDSKELPDIDTAASLGPTVQVRAYTARAHTVDTHAHTWYSDTQ